MNSKLNYLLSIFVLFFILFNQVFAEIFFSEIFPNTIDDANLEYIELYNSWSIEKSLSWFILKDKSDKQYQFWSWETIWSWQTKKYFRTQTKILLNNSGEELFLYDNSWILVDSFSYSSSIKSKVYKNY
jgi:hypothetical protein